MVARRSPGQRGHPGRDTDLSSLLGFYLACVEEEEKRSLEVSANRKHGQYIPTPGEPGALFRGESQLEWEPDDLERRFLERYSLAGQNPRFLYGYPLYYNRRGYVSPLFFSEAQVTRDETTGRSRIHLTHPSIVQVNLHPFRRTHEMILERLELQEELESSDYGTIDARVTAALRILDVSPPEIQQISTPRGRAGWKNASLLIRDAGAAFTAQLRRELADLKRRPPDVSGTALQALLGSSDSVEAPPAPLLEIAPLSPSQRSAVTAALSQRLTVITGPPGTGKSQVVVALLASLGAQNLPVLFASKNNQAVDVVRRRLTTLLGDADWFLRLGSKANIEEEIASRIDAAANLPAPSETESLSDEGALSEAQAGRDSAERAIEDRAGVLEKYIAVMRELRITLSMLSQAWLSWVLEGCSPSWAADLVEHEITGKRLDVQALSEPGWPGLLLWSKRFFLGPRLLQSYHAVLQDATTRSSVKLPSWESSRELSWANLAVDFADLELLRRYLAAHGERDSLRTRLAEENSPAELAEALERASASLHEACVASVRSRILQRLSQNARRLPTLLKTYGELTQKAARLRQQAATEVQRDFARSAMQLMTVVPGVIVTNLSARRSLPMEPGMFECVVIDEASQCDIASAIPLILRAKRLVVIGDPKQLRHISSIDEQTEQRIAIDQDATALLAGYSYRTKSLYDCAAEAIDSRGREPYFLADHFRSHPEIIEFSNRVYYQRRLVFRAEAEESSEQAIFWHDVPSRSSQSRGSLRNEEEGRAVRDLVLKVISAPSFGPDATIGVVTPYRRQRELLERSLSSEPSVRDLDGRLRIGTVHTFQGDEADVIVFSPVVTNGVDLRAAEWISREEGLLNVALTRARHALHIVGDKAFCRKTPGPLGELAEFIDQREGAAHVTRTTSPAVNKAREVLKDLGHWYQEEFPEYTAARTYYLDFFVVGLSGKRYDIEIDGRQHFFSAEAIAEDDTRDFVLDKLGYRVIRIQAAEVVRNPEELRELLATLV